MAKSIWRRNDLIYYNRKINNGNGGGSTPSIPEYYMVQGEPHRIQTSLDSNDTFLAQSKMCFFYRYYTAEAISIKNQPTIPFSMKYYPVVTISRELFYCGRMRIRKNENAGSATYNYDYGKALLNYYISDGNLKWNSTNNYSNVYLVVGTGTDLYWLKVHHQSTDTTTERYRIHTYNSTYTGTDSWIPIGNNRNNRFTMDYCSLENDCVNSIVNDIDTLAYFSGHPEADVFMIGIPQYVTVQDPVFTENDLFKVITMMCEMLNLQPSPYTSLIPIVVEHST